MGFAEVRGAGRRAGRAAARPGSMVRCHTLLSLRELGRRAEFLNAQLERLDELIVPLVTARARGLPGWYGITVALRVTHHTRASPRPVPGSLCR
jgi:hypothetical protein